MEPSDGNESTARIAAPAVGRVDSVGGHVDQAKGQVEVVESAYPLYLDVVVWTQSRQEAWAPMWAELLVEVGVVILMLGRKGRNLYQSDFGSAAVRRSYAVPAASVVLHRDLVEVQRSCGDLVAAARVKCESAAEFVVVAVAAAAVVEFELAAGN